MSKELSVPALFKCLADDTRARMTLQIAAQGELCVCDLTRALGLSQPKISRHLALLREQAVLLDRRQGQWVYYQLHPQLPAWVMQLLQGVLTANRRWLFEGLVQDLSDGSKGLCAAPEAEQEPNP